MLKKLVLLTAAGTLAAGTAYAQIDVKLGVLNDRSGIYADLAGEGSVEAVRMAIEDFKAAEKGLNVTVISADHQNKRSEERRVGKESGSREAQKRYRKEEA